MKIRRFTSLLMAIMMVLSLFSQPAFSISAINTSNELLSIDESTDGNDSSDSEELPSNSNEIPSSEEQTNNSEEQTNNSEEQTNNSEEQTNNSEEQTNSKEASTNVAPENYEPKNTFIKKGFSAFSENNTQKRVLLIEDNDPWNTQSNQVVLSGIAGFDKVSTSEFLSVDLSKYGVVVFANDQPFETYSNYTQFKDYLELFAKLGGVIVFGAADAGWANGSLIEDLPGGVKKTNHYEYRNYIADESHPIVTGIFTDNKVLRNSELYEKYTSHVSFNEDTLPPGTKVILREKTTNKPTLIEYPLEKGRVIASGLTWEYNYVNGGRYIDWFSFEQYGTYAKTAMEDMFKYAIRVSDISVDDIKALKEFYLSNADHRIIVTSRETTQPISGVTVEVDGAEFVTDDNGAVRYKGAYGEKLVTISKDGYRTVQQKYNLQQRTARFIFLEEATQDGLPYLTRVQDRDTYFDLRSQTKRFIQGDKEMLYLEVAGDWGNESKGSYVLYQEGEAGGPAGKKLESSTGVFYFAPGLQLNPEQPVKLKMVSKNGVSSTPIKINLFIDEAQAPSQDNYGVSLGNTHSFQIADEQQGSINDDLIAKIFPKDINMKAAHVPVNLSRSVGNDGTITWKGTIGVVNYDILEKEAKWNTYVNDIQNMNKNKNRAELYRLGREFGGKSSFRIQPKLWNAEVDTVGYIEVKQDKNGKIIENKGGVVVNGSGSAKYSRQFVYAFVPIYIDLTGKVDIGIQGDLKYSNEKQKIIPAGGELTITPQASIGSGLGVSGMATAGVEGGAGLKVNIIPENEGTLELWAKIKLYLYNIAEDDIEIAKKSFKLWPENNIKSLGLFNENYEISKSEWSLISRDYAEKTTNWNGDNKTRMSLLNDEQSDRSLSLQDWIMPNTMPQITKVGDKLIALFHYDDKTRNTGDNTVLMYSVYDNETWSEPKSIWESETGDLYFKTLVYNDELYVIWQKSKNKVIQTEVNDLIDEVTKNSEISFAKWNNNTQAFENQQFITDNNLLDMYPTIASNGNNVTALWVSNSANNPFGESGTYSIMKSTLSNGKWSSPSVVYKTTDYVTELAAGYINGELRIAYSVHKEEDIPNIYLLENGTAEPISKSAHSNALKFGNNKFYWQSNGSIFEYNISSDVLNAITPGKFGVITSSYQMIENGEKSAIVWLTVGEESSTVYASIRTTNGWSEPISLYNSEDFTIQFMDAELIDSGEWKIIMNKRDYIYEEQMNSLVFANVNPKADTLLNYVYADETQRDKDVQPIEFSVTNNGENDVNTLSLKMIKDDDVYFEKDIDCQIKPGETVVLTEDVDVSDITKETEVTVSVVSNEESDDTNNSDVITLGLANVSVKLAQHRIDNKIIVTAQVSNNSVIPANVAISVVEDSLDGVVLDMKNIGTLDNQSDYVYVYSIDLKNVNFDGNDSKYYYFKIDTLETDLNEYDNSDIVVALNENEKEISNDPIEDIQVTNVTGVSVSSQKVTLKLDDLENSSTKLTATVTPSNATNPHVKWQSENADVAKVDQNGLVTAVGVGDTKVKATTYDGNFVGTVDVTVSAKVESHSLNLVANTGGSITVGENGNYESGTVINLTAKPDDGYRFKNWTSSNGGTFGNATSGITTFTMPPNTTTVTANFEPEEPIDKKLSLIKLSEITELFEVNLKDIKNHWAEKQVNSLVEKGIVKGYSDETFKPNQNITRAEVTALISRMIKEEVDVNDSIMFKDTIPKWAEEVVKIGVSLEIISGYPDQTFRANKNITRAELAVMLNRLIQKVDYKAPANQQVSFEDTLPNWAKDDILELSSYGLINGYSDGTFKPNKSATRAEVTAIIHRLLTSQDN